MSAKVTSNALKLYICFLTSFLLCRSGLAVKNFIDVGAGVIDHDYTGEVKVLLFNFSSTEFKVEKGTRIAQLVIEKIFMPDLVEVDVSYLQN